MHRCWEQLNNELVCTVITNKVFFIRLESTASKKTSHFLFKIYLGLIFYNLIISLSCVHGWLLRAYSCRTRRRFCRVLVLFCRVLLTHGEHSKFSSELAGIWGRLRHAISPLENPARDANRPKKNSYMFLRTMHKDKFYSSLARPQIIITKNTSIYYILIQ